jgi:hypothetical protein
MMPETTTKGLKVSAKTIVAGVLLGACVLSTLVLANDATHPSVQQDTCRVLSVGPAVQHAKSQAQLLYKNGSNPLHDVALTCNSRGVVWLNEPNPLGLERKAGKLAYVKIKRYHYLPQQWRVSIGL